MATHRLHVPWYHSAAAPYNDLPVDTSWRWMGDSGFDPIAMAPVTVDVGAATSHVLYSDEVRIFTTGGPDEGFCDIGLLRHWAATQTGTVTLDLSGVPSDADGIVVPVIGGFPTISSLTLSPDGEDSPPDPAWSATLSVDGVEYASWDQDAETLSWTAYQGLPVPPELFGAPPGPVLYPSSFDSRLILGTDAEWYLWWGPAVGDDLPQTVTFDVVVSSFGDAIDFLPYDASGMLEKCLLEQDAFIRTFTPSYADGLDLGESRTVPVYGVKIVPVVPVVPVPGTIDLTPGPEGKVDVKQPVAGDIGSHLGGQRLPKAALEQLARRHGAPDPNLAAAVALAESGGYTGATNSYVEGGVTHIVYGLWQISDIHAGEGFNVGRAFDQDYNAEWMMRLSDNGTDWSAWEGYTNGSYLQYL